MNRGYVIKTQYSNDGRRVGVFIIYANGQSHMIAELLLPVGADVEAVGALVHSVVGAYHKLFKA